MEKSYETYAKKALMLKHTHKQEAGKIRDTIGQIDSNQRLSDFPQISWTTCGKRRLNLPLQVWNPLLRGRTGYYWKILSPIRQAWKMMLQNGLSENMQTVFFGTS